MRALKANIERRWYTQPGWLYLLYPLKLFFHIAQFFRKKKLLRKQSKVRRDIPLPIVVVGNISVGGTGKTPVIIFLVNLLQAQGYQVGVVTRGYGALNKHNKPTKITAQSQASNMGDEPVVIFNQTQCTVYVCSNRVLACKEMLAHENIDIILSDDGMQHYALPRDMEVAVIDGNRLLGNGHLLPMGPLREPPERLSNVDWLLVNGQSSNKLYNYSCAYKWPRSIFFSMRPRHFVNVKTKQVKPLDFFENSQPILAVAGIGNPDRFYTTLYKLGFNRIETKRFDDHYQFKASDFTSQSHAAIIMTEKDAVKCQSFASDNMWFLSVSILLDAQFQKEFLSQTKQHIDKFKR